MEIGNDWFVGNGTTQVSSTLTPTLNLNMTNPLTGRRFFLPPVFLSVRGNLIPILRATSSLLRKSRPPVLSVGTHTAARVPFDANCEQFVNFFVAFVHNLFTIIFIKPIDKPPKVWYNIGTVEVRGTPPTNPLNTYLRGTTYEILRTPQLFLFLCRC